MFKIDPTANRINSLEVKRFSDLGFTERKHLQEWLENYPQALALAQGDGEELLIIQKEFDGFDDTRERLDPLAIDKEGKFQKRAVCKKCILPNQTSHELLKNP